MNLKKLFSFLVIVLSVNSLSAQIQKGVISLEGSINFQSEKYNSLQFNNSIGSVVTAETKAKFFSFAPQIGFFTSGSFVTGMGLQYSHDKTTTEDFYYSETSEIQIAPYVRKYWGIINNLYFTTTLSVGAGYGNLNRDHTTYKENYEIQTFQANLSPGLTFFVSDNFSVTANIGSIYYRYEKQEPYGSDNFYDDFEYKDSSAGASLALRTMSIGFQYLINRKSE